MSHSTVHGGGLPALTARFLRIASSLRAAACFLNPPFWRTQSAVKIHPGFVVKITRADTSRPQRDALTKFAAAVLEEAMMSERMKKQTLSVAAAINNHEVPNDNLKGY